MPLKYNIRTTHLPASPSSITEYKLPGNFLEKIYKKSMWKGIHTNKIFHNIFIFEENMSIIVTWISERDYINI